MKMEILHLTKETFHGTIASGTTLVDFWAGWCMPCKMLAPVIEELAGELGDSVKIGKVDVDAEGELALEFGIMSIPTVVVFRDGREVQRFVGVQPKEVYLNTLRPPESDVTTAEDTPPGEEE